VSVSSSITPISPIHVRISPIHGMAPPPIVICAGGTITITDAVATVHEDTVSSIGISSWSATVPTSIACVVAIHKLCTLLIPIGSAPPASTSTLRHRRSR